MKSVNVSTSCIGDVFARALFVGSRVGGTAVQSGHAERCHLNHLEGTLDDRQCKLAMSFQS